MTAAYTSVVVGRGHIAVGVLFGIVALVLVPPWELGLAVAAVLAATGFWVSCVRLAVGPDEVRVALGPAGRSRRIPRASIATARAAQLTGGQALGLGLPWRAHTTRLTVRPGPTLVVELCDGEVVRVSTPEPDVAVGLLVGADRPSGHRGGTS